MEDMQPMLRDKSLAYIDCDGSSACPASTCLEPCKPVRGRNTFDGAPVYATGIKPLCPMIALAPGLNMRTTGVS